MIKNIVFDLGNVILEKDPMSVLEYMNLTNEEIKVFKESIFNEEIWKLKLDYGKMNLDEYYDVIKRDIPSSFREKGKNILLSINMYRKINEDVLMLIKKLYRNKYSIYILSDNNIDIYNYLKTTELNSYVSGFCISALYGATKSDKKLFEIFFNEFHLNPSECYFVDDNKLNIEIAREYGMIGFGLNWENNNLDDLINDMKQNKINI